MIEITGSQ